jgi:gluconolactonase
MSRILGVSVAIVVALLNSAKAQTPAGTSVVRIDSRLDAIISATARLEPLKEDYFGATEGPVWVKDGGGGYLLFSDMAANRVYKWTAKDGLSVFLERSGFTGTEMPIANVLNNGRLNVALIGSNGLALDREGRLVLCTHGDRSIWRLEKDGSRTVLADRYEGKRINGPNDIAIKSDGAIYFTDRGSGLRGGAKSPQRELAFGAIFRWKNGKLDVLDKDDGANGIAFSPDEKYLFIITAGKIVRYDVQNDGTIANRQLFIDTTTDKAPGAPDGMKVDQKGNMFTTGPGGAWIVTPQGELLGKILLPQTATNIAFGDPDGKGVYFTCFRSVYHIRLSAPAM